MEKENRYGKKTRQGLWAMDTWRSKIVVLGSLAGSFLTIVALSTLLFNATKTRADCYIDGRATAIYNKRIEPVYRMAAESNYILREQTDAETIKRAMAKMKSDSVSYVNQQTILGR